MAYSLSTSYVGDSLVSGFNWFNGKDPSHGFVSYQSQQDAMDQSLYSVDPETKVVRLGVDSTNKFTLDQGRPSVRLESKEAYTHGLFIADFLHMPPSQCGVWPAFWTYGTDWPNGGEIDIIEGANTVYSNIISAHTTEGCVLDPADSNLYAGVRRDQNCDIGDDNVGCGYDPPGGDVSTYGDGFNAANGGVYAMLWDEEFIRVWHFARSKIPSDIQAKNPDPKGWGLPDALFGGAKCDADKYFKNMNIVINIYLCGDYGSGTWKDTCGHVADTCEDYVANNPDAFKSAHWDVQYIDVYQQSNTTQVITKNTTTSVLTPTVPRTTTTPVPVRNSNMTMTTLTPEPTTTTTMTTLSTVTVTVPRLATETPKNPAKIGDYSYLGCFGSDTAFSTFNKSEDSQQMTLERCIASCDGATYSGVVESKCYCANGLDASTRAVANEKACNRPCPGNSAELCGGFVGQQPVNSTLSSSRDKSSLVGRQASSNFLLTMYGSVAGNSKPPTPPAMAEGSPNGGSGQQNPVIKGQQNPVIEGSAVEEVITTITYWDVAPTDAKKLTQLEYVATVTITKCPDGEQMNTAAAEAAAATTAPIVPLEIKVVACERCGANGENSVTVTVPVTLTARRTKHVTAVVTAKVQHVEQAMAIVTPHPTPYHVPNNGTGIPTNVPVIAAAAGGLLESAKMSLTMGMVAIVLVAMVL